MTRMADGATGDKAAGIALLASAAGVVAGMAHHPTRISEAALSVLVHGFLLVMLWVMASAFVHFARRRGLDRPWVLAGLVAYGFGLMANVGAATVNGLVTPSLAAGGADAAGREVLAFAWALNQGLDAVGVFGTGAAFILWSLDLLAERRASSRLVGAAGVAAGVLTAGLLASGAVRMNVSGAFLIYAIEVAWVALLGLHILRHGAARQALAPEHARD